MCGVTCRALDDPFLSGQGETAVNALLESGELARGDTRVVSRHRGGIRMAPGAHHGDPVAGGFSNEPGRFVHGLFHVVGRGVPSVTTGAGDPVPRVYVVRKERGRPVAESLVTCQAAVPRVRTRRNCRKEENQCECRCRKEDLFHKNHPSIVKTRI